MGEFNERVFNFLTQKHRIEVLLSEYLGERDSNGFDLQRGEIITIMVTEFQVMRLYINK